MIIGSFLRIQFLLSLLCASYVCLSASPTSAAAQQESGNTDADLKAKEAELVRVLKTDGSAEISAPKVVEKDATKAAPAKQSAAAKSVTAEKKSAAEDIKKIQELEAQVAERQGRIDTLVQEISETRNRLLIAETEVERLSAIIDDRNRRQIAGYGNNYGQPRASVARRAPPAAATATPLPQPQRFAATAPRANEPDMQIITVTADKAFLRTGPGQSNSPLMSVSRGTRLTVETRSGEWYRVISPAGTRAWISADVVAFGDSQGAPRIGGFNANAEDRAFQLLKQR